MKTAPKRTSRTSSTQIRTAKTAQAHPPLSRQHETQPQALKAPLTQTRAWQKLQEALGKESFLVQRPDFRYLAILSATPVGNYLYLPYGPVYASEKAFQQALASLESLAKEQRAVFVRIEPQDPNFASYAPQNAVKTRDLSPRETWVLDLTGKEEDLQARCPERLRRYHRTAAKRGITVEMSHDPEDIHFLLGLQKALADQKGIKVFSEHYLKTELAQPFATLYLAKKEGEVLAAGLVFDDAETRYNLQGAQSEAGRRLHATGILTIQLILDARAKGLKNFDFWGIAPEGAADDHPWAGFTAFKKTFSGVERDYAGTYDLVFNPGKYRLYEIMRRLNRRLRRG